MLIILTDVDLFPQPAALTHGAQKCTRLNSDPEILTGGEILDGVDS